MIDNYSCVVKSNRFTLQGMLYVTDQSAYFYSPFNSKTFIGIGSKIHLPYSAIKTIKKESSLLIFKTSIRFLLKSG